MTGRGGRRALVAGLWLATAAAWPGPPARAAVGAPSDSASSGRLAVQARGVRIVWRFPPELSGVARSLGAAPAALAPMPGLGPPAAWLGDSVTVLLVRTPAELESLAGGSLPGHVAGIALPERGEIGLLAETGARPAELRPVLRHEIAHLALSAATGGNAPIWLEEGYAQFASGAWDWAEAWRLRFVLLRSGAAPLREWSRRFAGSSAEVENAYMLSFTAVQQLQRQGGDRALASLFRRLREGASFDAALRSVYGMTEVQFERHWRESVMHRYGWLYVLSRAGIFWVAVASLLVLVYLRRRQLKRRRLGEMRASEAAAQLPAEPAPSAGTAGNDAGSTRG